MWARRERFKTIGDKRVRATGGRWDVRGVGGGGGRKVERVGHVPNNRRRRRCEHPIDCATARPPPSHYEWQARRLQEYVRRIWHRLCSRARGWLGGWRF